MSACKFWVFWLWMWGWWRVFLCVCWWATLSIRSTQWRILQMWLCVYLCLHVCVSVIYIVYHINNTCFGYRFRFTNNNELITVASTIILTEQTNKKPYVRVRFSVYICICVGVFWGWESGERESGLLPRAQSINLYNIWCASPYNIHALSRVWAYQKLYHAF